MFNRRKQTPGTAQPGGNFLIRDRITDNSMIDLEGEMQRQYLPPQSIGGVDERVRLITIYL